jgi:nicotinate-nucleotide adenylyltransferase
MAAEKLILFGGTFDPIHLGHTAVAAYAQEQICADRLIFILARCSPLKGFSPRASDDERLEMIRVAISENPGFAVSEYELRRPAPSYTLDTVRYFKAAHGGETEIYWLVGADGVEDLRHWHKIEELLDACNVSVMYRAGWPVPDFGRFERVWGRERVEKLKRNVVATPLVDISSTQIRDRLAHGQEIRGMVHSAVERYIRERGLYRGREAP